VIAAVAASTTTFDALRAAAEVHAERTALIHVETGDADEVPRTLSYAQLLAGITKAANAFRRLGADRNTCVALLLPNVVEHHLALWGAQAASVALPLNPLLQPAHLIEILRATKARILLAPGPAHGNDLWETALLIKATLPSIVWLVQVGTEADPGADTLSFARVVEGASGEALEFDRSTARGCDIAAYFHTGGTTGAPKVVKHSHTNELSAAAGFAAMAQLGPTDVLSNGFPLFHVAGALVCTLAPLLVGAAVLNLSAAGYRNPKMVLNYWRMVERYRVSIVGGVPTALRAIAAAPINGADLSSIRTGYTGGAPVPRSVATAFESASGKPLREVYGMTEAAGVIAVDAVTNERTLGSAGRPPEGTRCEVRLLLADGRPGALCAIGEAGVLLVGGPTVTPGYLDPDHDRSALAADGMLITGDLARIDATGRITITGRSKDLIIRSGHNIDPAAIEEALAAHPAVAVVAVVGQPDRYAGELPVAYVTLREGASFDAEALMAFACKRIPERPAWPKQIFELPTLPLTAVGKVYKPGLRQDAAHRLVTHLLCDLPVHLVDVASGSHGGLQVVVTVSFPGEGGAELARVRNRLEGFLFEVIVQC